jgi:ATP-dependent 26S proteasome regulatory subunit
MLAMQQSNQTHFGSFVALVKQVIMATNKIESLDPALIRPGRIDRKIEFPLPDIKTKRHIFGIHTSRMTLSDDVDLEVCLEGLIVDCVL